MIYREAQPKDLNMVSKLICEDFRKEIENELPYLSEAPNPYSFVAKWSARLVNKNANNMFLAMDGDKLAGASAGSVGLQQYSDYPLYGKEDFWYVQSSYRRGKIGVKLYRMLIDWFKSKGAERICMTYYPFADKVKNFYEKQGFKPLEQIMVLEI